MKQPFQFSDEDRTMTIYHYSPATYEFLGQEDALIPAQTGLPACCTDTATPDTHESFIPVFTDKGWVLVEDHRGKMAYCTTTGTTLFISELGELPRDITFNAPTAVFDTWSGHEWIRDNDKIAAIARDYRDTFLSTTDAMMTSDFSVDDIPLTESKRSELIATRAAYRAWPTLADWPLIELPDIPQWLLIEAVNKGYRVPIWPIS